MYKKKGNMSPVDKTHTLPTCRNAVKKLSSSCRVQAAHCRVCFRAALRLMRKVILIASDKAIPLNDKIFMVAFGCPEKYSSNMREVRR